MSISSIADIIRTHGRGRPERPALEFESRTITFGELDARSSQVANALAAEGVHARDRVAFLDKNGVEYFEVAFGVAKLNAVTVAVNWRLAPLEMARVVADAGAGILIIGAEFIAHVEKIEAELAAGTRIIVIGGHDRWDNYTTWCARQPSTDPGVESTAEDVAVQVYTSGTTGLPKGAMLTNDSFFWMLGNVSERWRFDGDSVNLAAMPMFHIAGSGWSMVGLYHGCQTVLLREVDPAVILRADPAVRRHERAARAGRDPGAAQHPRCRDDRLFDAANDRLWRVADHRYGARQGRGGVRLRVHPGLWSHRDDGRDH